MSRQRQRQRTNNPSSRAREGNSPARPNPNPTDRAALVALLTNLQNQLDELTERIDPAPAPLPETVSLGRLQCLPPLYARRTAVDKAAENLRNAVHELKCAVKPLRKEIPAASNVRAWAYTMDSMSQSVQNGVAAITRQSMLRAQLLVLAANGEVELPEGMDDGEGVEAGNE